MGLDSPLMPNELPGYIFFLFSFSSSSSPSLGKGGREMFDQRARKDLKKCIINLSCLSQLVGCITGYCKHSLCLITPPPPPPQFSHSQMTEAYQLQVHEANKIWLRDFVHKNNWKLFETFLNLRKSFKTSKTEWKYFRFQTLYVVLPPPPPFFSHAYSHHFFNFAALIF